MRLTILFVTMIALLGCSSPIRAEPAARPNVLFLIVDDMADWAGCLDGHPDVPPACCPVLDKNEDWAAATAIVAARRAWMPGAMRVIIPISDEAAEGGDPCTDPGPDKADVYNAAIVARTNSVFVAPIMGNGTNPCVVALAAQLADLTGGEWFASNDPGGLPTVIVTILEDLCRAGELPPASIIDLCPNDPLKLTPGVCGCGVSDSDLDGDGTIECLDNCPGLFNPTQADKDSDGSGDACEGGTGQPLPETGCGAGACGASSAGALVLGLWSLCGMKLARRRRR